MANQSGNALDKFQALHDRAVAALFSLPDDTGDGVAPHSLHAVGVENFRSFGATFPTGPIHLHLAEQAPEVHELLQHWGAWPVTRALDNMGLDALWYIIHCTQMTSQETVCLAQSGAVAGLCLITEIRLGNKLLDLQCKRMGADARALYVRRNIVRCNVGYG